MGIKVIAIFLSLTFVISCSVQNVGKKTYEVNGTISASKYNLAVPSNISFLINNEVIAKTTSDKNGEFNTEIPKQYRNNDCQVIVQPI